MSPYQTWQNIPVALGGYSEVDSSDAPPAGTW